MTLNVQQQPRRLFQRGRRLKRIRLLAQEIKRIQPDILCVQELFYRRSREVLVKELSDLLPYVYLDCRCGKYLVGVNSGLAIFSRFQIVEEGLMQFKTHAGVDTFARKGIMKIQVHDDEIGGDLTVFNTHMQAGIGSTPWPFRVLDRLRGVAKLSSDDLSQAQARELFDVVMMVEEDHGIGILAGDFNIRASEELFHAVETELNAMGYYDSFAEEEHEEEDEEPTTVIGKPDRRIDFIWVWNVFENDGYIDDTTNTWAKITDHYPVFVSLDHSVNDNNT